jgi:ABC-type iron transport system FetAB ATPase subunit
MFDVSGLVRNDLPPVSFSLAPGELVCLSGPSGCGKTQLLRSLVDLDLNQGEVALKGEPRESVDPPQWRRRVGYLSAESRWWEATVAGHFSALDPQRLRRLGFEGDVGAWRIERLSSGEKQRLALLRLLSNRPEVLLLDEPTANLDSANTRAVEALVRDYLSETQAACLWVSHDREQIARLCHRRLDMTRDGLREAA